MDALYLRDSYLREWDAEVLKSDRKDEGADFVVLDRTAFYPSSGGQPHDTGRMTRLSDGREFRVVYAGKFGMISHEVFPNGLKRGDMLRCALDWERRYRLMRMHTAAHIISGVLNKETGALISGNQLDTGRSRIDFSVAEFDREKLKGYEAAANEVAGRGLPVTFEFMSRADAMKDPSLTKLAKGIEHLPHEITELRILKIGDFDAQADGGTHVKNTSEVGRMRFVDFSNKGAKNRRIYFALEP